MTERAKRHASVYFPQGMLDEIDAERVRQQRSRAWLVQRAWKIARAQIAALPSDNDAEKEDKGDE